MKGFKSFLNEASLNRVRQHVAGRNVGVITAYRGGLPKAENEARNTQLAADLRGHGFGFIKIKGRYIENYGSENANPVDEHSYLVVGKDGPDEGHLKGVLSKLGQQYEQDSVLHKSHDQDEAFLHGTKKDAWPGLGNAESVGQFHPNRAGEFHSLLRNKKPFTFVKEGVEVTEYPFVDIQFVEPVSFSRRKETDF
jgi:hypothetical protein